MFVRNKSSDTPPYPNEAYQIPVAVPAAARHQGSQLPIASVPTMSDAEVSRNASANAYYPHATPQYPISHPNHYPSSSASHKPPSAPPKQASTRPAARQTKKSQASRSKIPVCFILTRSCRFTGITVLVLFVLSILTIALGQSTHSMYLGLRWLTSIPRLAVYTYVLSALGQIIYAFIRQTPHSQTPQTSEEAQLEEARTQCHQALSKQDSRSAITFLTVFERLREAGSINPQMSIDSLPTLMELNAFYVRFIPSCSRNENSDLLDSLLSDNQRCLDLIKWCQNK